MTDQPGNTGAPWQPMAALITGLASLAALIVFFVFSVGATPLLFAALLGAVAIIFGIIGVRRGSQRGKAITGIITGAFSLLISAGIFIFALLFIGAFGI